MRHASISSAALVLVLATAGCGGSSTGDSTTDGAVDSGDTDGSVDDGGGTDAGDVDGGGGTDAGDVDGGGGPPCEGMTMGTCTGGLMCLGCPSGPIMEHYLCTTECSSDTDCTDAARPHCNRDMTRPGMSGPPGLCTEITFACTWGVVCASPDTAIATPDGERPIASLHEGDLVYSVDHDALVAVPLLAARSVEAEPHHQVVRVTLATGRVVEMSAGHPTADDRLFADLRAGGTLDGTSIVSAERVPFAYERTYDILPASDTGTYVAAGVLVGSTLWRPVPVR